MRDGTMYDLSSLRTKLRNTARWGNTIQANLLPTERVRVGETLQTVIDGAMELYYLLADTIREIEEEA